MRKGIREGKGREGKVDSNQVGHGLQDFFSSGAGTMQMRAGIMLNYEQRKREK